MTDKTLWYSVRRARVKRNFYWLEPLLSKTSRVSVVLLRGNSTFTFLINLYWEKAFPRPEHSIRIAQYHRKNIMPKPNIFTKTRTQGSFRVCDLTSCNLLADRNNSVLCAVLLSCLVSELRKKYIHRGTNTGVALDVLVVCVLATGPKVRGFKPGRGRWILRVIKSVARLPSEGK
jgi:hypothetical protein